MSVLLPDPDGPITAVNTPAGIPTVTSSRARTSVVPRPYVFTALATRAAIGRFVGTDQVFAGVGARGASMCMVDASFVVGAFVRRHVRRARVGT